MCITIPSSPNVARSRSFPLWNRLAASPARLLGFAALISLSAWCLMWLFSTAANPLWMTADLVFAVLPIGLFGLMLGRMPEWLKVTPLRYVNYGILFYLLLTAQLVFHLSILLGAQPGWLFGLLSLAGWWLVLKYTRQFFMATYQRTITLENAIRLLLNWGAVATAGGYLALLLTQAGSLMILALAGLSYLLPLAILLLIRNAKSDPRIH
ncbi:MAG: hypothetical protein ABW095_08395 [Candidatus Thiodiazotropha sp.]